MTLHAGKQQVKSATLQHNLCTILFVACTTWTNFQSRIFWQDIPSARLASCFDNDWQSCDTPARREQRIRCRAALFTYRHRTHLRHRYYSVCQESSQMVPVGSYASSLNVKKCDRSNDSYFGKHIVATSLGCFLKIAGFAQSLTYHVSAWFDPLAGRRLEWRTPLKFIQFLNALRRYYCAQPLRTSSFLYTLFIIYDVLYASGMLKN